MYHSDDFIDEILQEWAQTIENGKPDPTDCYHVSLLSQVLYGMNLSTEFIGEFIGNFNIEQGNICEHSFTGSYDSGSRRYGGFRFGHHHDHDHAHDGDSTVSTGNGGTGNGGTGNGGGGNGGATGGATGGGGAAGGGAAGGGAAGGGAGGGGAGGAGGGGAGGGGAGMADDEKEKDEKDVKDDKKEK